MDLVQLRCFLAVADELHFGRAARRLDMLPASLGRHLKLLEESLGTQLVNRTTRHVALTPVGAELLPDARALITQAEAFASKARNSRSEVGPILRIGAIDSAAIGLMPVLLNAFRQSHPDIDVTLHEQKTIRLMPRLISGRLDLIFIRRPEKVGTRLHCRHLLAESAVVAVPRGHRFEHRESLSIADLVDEPMIVPERQSRPHSHDLTIKLFLQAELTARIGQIAEEKHTIVNMVSSGLGLAIVPRWSSRLSTEGVAFIPLLAEGGRSIRKLDLSVAWVANTRDPVRDKLMECLDENLPHLVETA